MSVNGLEITAIKVHPATEKGSGLVGFARIVLNANLCINSIRIVNGKFGLFISFPREFAKGATGRGFNICYPITKALQDYLSERILRTWHVEQGQHLVEAG